MLIFVPWKQLLKDLWRTYSFMDVRLTESTPLLPRKFELVVFKFSTLKTHCCYFLLLFWMGMCDSGLLT